MAGAPDHVNVRNFAGTYRLNKKLILGDLDAGLSLQGVGLVARKAIKWSGLTIKVNQKVQENGVIFLDMDQFSGVLTNKEPRYLDWEWRSRHDFIFGKAKGAIRYAKLGEIDDDFLTKDIDTRHDDTVIYTENESLGLSTNWSATQLWAFSFVDGERRHVRRVAIKRGKKRIDVVLVYDWVPEVVEKAEDDQEEEELPGA